MGRGAHRMGEVARAGIVDGRPFPIPEGLDWVAGLPGGRGWLEELPRLVESCVRSWGLSVGSPFAPGGSSWVAPAETPDRARAVLKVSFPGPEGEHESDALALWDGRGAVRLLAADRASRGLLIERCEPGAQLWEVEDEELANRTAANVLRELWRPAPDDGPFRLLAVEAERWARVLPARWSRHDRPCSRRLIETGMALARRLAASQPELVVCHQDLHGGNVLAAGAGRWLAIDPKPLVGERAFDVASLLRDRRVALLRADDPEEVVAGRLELLSAELDLDRERARGWGIVHALAWGLTEEAVYPDLLACAELLDGV